MKTNATIIVKQKLKDWTNKVTYGPDITLKVWLEESTQTRFSGGNEIFYAAGYFITDTDLDYMNYAAVINGITYDIFNRDRYSNAKGFHHAEVYFK